MKVKSWECITPSFTHVILNSSIDSMIENNHANGNYWLDVTAIPKNNIEQYILDCWDLYLKEEVVGFEWWFHKTENHHDYLPAHFDCDESLRVKTNKIVTPITSTVTYLSISNTPTIITNVELIGDADDQHEPKYPTEVVYSFPGPGKFITFDSKYLHGFGAAEKGRTTLMFNLWKYKPEDLPECTYTEELKDLQFYMCDEDVIQFYDGDVSKTAVEYFGRERKLINYPATFKSHDTLLLRA